MIDSFQGKNRWLSNFWPCSVVLDGDEYSSTAGNYFLLTLEFSCAGL